MLTDKQIQKFQALFRKHADKEISKEEALKAGENLNRLIKTIYKPPMINNQYAN